MEDDKKYLIVCLRNGCWESHGTLMFWGKNQSGYYLDIREAGLYTKEEATRICQCGDVFININKLGVDKEIMNLKTNKNITIRVDKTDEICRYINQFHRIMSNKRLMKWGGL